MDPIEKLVAIEEIRQLKSRYFRFIDTQDWDSMADVFCRDAVFDGTGIFHFTPLGGKPIGPTGPIVRGRDSIMDWIRDGFADQTSVHHGHGHEVTVESDGDAHGIVAMEDIIRDASRTKTLLRGFGHYTERYRFEEGEWRILESKLTRLFCDLESDRYEAMGEETAPD